MLQIGADIYCDTRLILREIDRRRPAPTLYPKGHAGSANAIAAWAEGQLFRPVMLYAWGTNHDLMTPELFADRARMRGLPKPSVAAVERAAARSAPLVRLQLSLIEEMLADGRRWLCGDGLTAADLAVYHAMWFMTDRSRRLAHEFAAFEVLSTWMKRVCDLEHGRPHRMSAEDALDVARACEPAAPRPSRPQPEDPGLGSLVEIRAADYAQDRIVGSLDFLDDDEVSIRISNDRVGRSRGSFPEGGLRHAPGPSGLP